MYSSDFLLYLLVVVNRVGGILSLYVVVVVTIFGVFCQYIRWLLSLLVVIVTISDYCHYIGWLLSLSVVMVTVVDKP